jgi:hypothetical protein
MSVREPEVLLVPRRTYEDKVIPGHRLVHNAMRYVVVVPYMQEATFPEVIAMWHYLNQREEWEAIP